VLDSALKQRLIGATVLVSLAVIFIPMLLDGTDPTENLIMTSNIPDEPNIKFKSRVVPLATPQGDTQTSDKMPQNGANTEKPAIPPQPEVPKIPQQRADADKAVKSGVSAWVVQLGSFADEKNANQLQKRLRDKGFAAFVEPLSNGDQISFRVRVGPELTDKLATDLANKIEKAAKVKGIVVKYP
jgi:DedD protein